MRLCDTFTGRDWQYRLFEIITGTDRPHESLRGVAVDTRVRIDSVLVFECHKESLGIGVVGDLSDIPGWRRGDNLKGHTGIIIVIDMPLPSNHTLPAIILDRPLIRLYEISILINDGEFTIPELRTLCASVKPPIVPVSYHPMKRDRDNYDDLISPHNAHRLLRIVAKTRRNRIRSRPPDRLDRVSLLLWMCGFKPWQIQRGIPYSRTAEKEIKRIAKLREPHRTVRALDLMARYVDAKVIAENIPWRCPKEMEVIQRKLDRLCGLPDESE